jgi:hypothetical protein
LKIAIEALKECSAPKGAYSMDPLKFAQNTIRDVSKLAKEALAKIETG